MKRTHWQFILIGLLFAAPTRELGAQEFGLRLGYDSEPEEFTGGVALHFPITIGAVPKTTFGVVAEGFLIEEATILNFDLVARFFPWSNPNRSADPYFGGGVAIRYIDEFEETLGSFLVVTGIDFPRGGFVPFLEVNFATGDFDESSLTGGFRFRL